MAKTVYSEADLARLYVVLTTNEGNIKRTANDLNLPETTVRRYKRKWETEGPPKIEEEIQQAVLDYTGEMEKTRDLALQRMHERLEKDQGTLPQIATVFGVLTDKIDRARGVADRTVDHRHHLPSPDEIRASLGALIVGAQQAHDQREEDIVDAEIVSEDDPKALPR